MSNFDGPVNPEPPSSSDDSNSLSDSLLLSQVYEELRKLAAARLAHELPGQTLQPTALVHEAWLRMNAASKNAPQDNAAWQNRSHFFAAAAESMRRILVDRARQKRGPKAGGKWKRVDLDAAVSHGGLQFDLNGDEQLLAINDALELLARESPVKAELVKLRFFAGLEHQEAAAVLGISRATADRHWAYAKAFLYDALLDTNSEEP